MPLTKVLLWWLQLMQSPFCLAHLHASAHCALCILSTGGPVEWSSAHTTDLADPAIMQIKWENSFPISCNRLKLAAQDCLLRSQCLIGNADTRHPSVCPSCHTIVHPQAWWHPFPFRAGIMALQLKWKDEFALASCFSVLSKWQVIFHWWFESLFILLILLSRNTNGVFYSVKHCCKMSWLPVAL